MSSSPTDGLEDISNSQPQEGSLNGTHHNEQYENIKTLLLEQRIKTMEHEVLKQDSKINF
jgi:hypothetical protein